jgi:hypothetical protein
MATRNTDTGTGGGLPPAVVEELLSADSRRRALSILANRGEPVVVEDLAAAVVADREGCAPSAVSDAERAAMTEELFTDHIPTLTATDVLRYDSMLGAVELQRAEIAPTDQG